MRELYRGLYAERLPSGLYVLVEPMPRVRSVALGIWVRSGSREDPSGRGGLAHLVEHMSFKGTRRRSALEIAQAIDSLGGNLNGATAKESTFFHTNVLAEGLPIALEVLGEMLTQPRFSPDDLAREQAVVLEEIRGAEDDPQDLVLRLLFEQMWAPDHPLGRPILGTREEVAALTTGDLWEFFHRHYRPPNMVLAAAGKVEPAELIAQLEKIWPTERDGLDHQRVAPAPSSGLITASRDIQQVHLALGFPTVKADSPERYGLEVLAGLLGGGYSSRLFQRVREERGLAYTILASTAYYTDAGALLIYAATEEKRLAETLGLIWEEIDKLASSLPDRSELARTVDRLRGNLLLSLEDPGGRMFRLGTNAAIGREILPIAKVEELLQAVSPEVVQELARRFLRPERASLALVGAAEDRLRQAARSFLEAVR